MKSRSLKWLTDGGANNEAKRRKSKDLVSDLSVGGFG